MSVSVFRYIPLSLHGGIETIAAPLIMAGPLLLGLDQAAVLAGFLLGAILLGLSLSLFSEMTYAGVGFGLAVAAMVLGVGIGVATGDAGATVFLVGVGAAQMALTASTRFSVPRGV